MNEGEQRPLIDKIYGLIERNELTLPTLPDVAIRIRDLIDDPNVSGDKVVSVISTDPVITAQIVRAANSAAFADKPPVENVRAAISRLGYKQLRNIVLSITMSKLMQADSPVVRQHLTTYWQHSREVAAVSFVIALHQKSMNPDQALLAGLLHDIGVIPLCMCIDKTMPSADAQTLESVLHKFHTHVGMRLLQSWNFPQDLLDVVMEHENLQRESRTAPLPDYADVVSVANMQDRLTAKIAAWENVAAIRRLGMKPEDCQNFLERYAKQLTVVHDMLGIVSGKAGTAPPSPPPAKSPTPAQHSKPQAEEIGGLSGIFRKFFS